MSKGYLQIHDNEWIEPTRKFSSQCCDCSLVHEYEYAVVDRKTKEPIAGAAVQFKVRVNRRKTAANRRNKDK